MTPFLDDNFLLRSETARRLYFEHAADQPIYDYHNHLIPAEIAGDRRFDNLAQIWLDGDHYKWRAMRTAGIDERLITGDASDYDKFVAFANVMPLCIGNPIYHWAHMELRRPFGIRDRLLGPDTADEIWHASKSLLADPAYGARGILESFNVKMVATTDDPVDSLEHHVAVRSDASCSIRMLPTWRPDRLFKPERDDFVAYIEALGEAAGVDIDNYERLLEALDARLDHFASLGCVSADHGFDRLPFCASAAGNPAQIFEKRLAGRTLTADEAVSWFSSLVVWLGRQYAKRGWVMQLHIGARRDNNSTMLERLGPNTGYDSIGDANYSDALAGLLDALNRDDALPKTILYCLNPRDNEMLATMTGNFQGGGVPGKLQFGSAWWFNDQKDGMQRQLTALAQMGLLSQFVGMLTDSRSLVSFSRHEYFRRLLCDLIGGWVEAGEAPADFDLLGKLVEDVCVNNTVAYFGLGETRAG